MTLVTLAWIPFSSHELVFLLGRKILSYVLSCFLVGCLFVCLFVCLFLQVGCGAIGCELLKNFALLGVAASHNGLVIFFL